MLPLVAAIVLGGAGCGGVDPTEPRPVKTQDPVGEAPEQVPAEQDRTSSTRGLACDTQRGALRLRGASTGDCKASFNADPDERKRRTMAEVATGKLGEVMGRLVMRVRVEYFAPMSPAEYEILTNVSQVTPLLT